jgi:hypothetical protein
MDILKILDGPRVLRDLALLYRIATRCLPIIQEELSNSGVTSAEAATLIQKILGGLLSGHADDKTN